MLDTMFESAFPPLKIKELSGNDISQEKNGQQVNYLHNAIGIPLVWFWIFFKEMASVFSFLF